MFDGNDDGGGDKDDGTRRQSQRDGSSLPQCEKSLMESEEPMRQRQLPKTVVPCGVSENQIRRIKIQLNGRFLIDFFFEFLIQYLEIFQAIHSISGDIENMLYARYLLLIYHFIVSDTDCVSISEVLYYISEPAWIQP